MHPSHESEKLVAGIQDAANKINQETAGKEKPATIKAPPYCVFQTGQTIPLSGWNWRVVGYTKEFFLVLECEGMTGKRRKEIGRNR